MRLKDIGLGKAFVELGYTLAASAVLITAMMFVMRHTGEQTPGSTSTQDDLSSYYDKPALQLNHLFTTPILQKFLGRRALLILTSESCTFCRASGSFHALMAKTAAAKGWAVLIAVPNPTASEEFLASAGLSGYQRCSWLDLPGRTRGVPSVVLLDESHHVAGVWVGQLDMSREQIVLRALDDLGAIAEPKRSLISGEPIYSVHEASKLPGHAHMTLISPRERNANFEEVPFPIINIPITELTMRMQELEESKKYLFDCTMLDDFVCGVALDSLRERHITVAAIDTTLSK